MSCLHFAVFSCSNQYQQCIELKYLKFNSSYVGCYSIFVVFSLIVVTIGFEGDKLLFGEA